MNKNLRAKVIAFYLPQFHCIPENDNAHGKGFTEWTNTRKAKPLFEGHYQPRTPLNNNYYNLLEENVMRSQAEIAKKNGVYGFCYYHYWFKGGKKLLEKPIENMLNDSKININFCLSWANENWTRKWDGGNNEIIVEQDYGNEKEWEDHFQYLLPFFKDDRYIKIDGKPLFMIYKPELMPNCDKWVRFIRKRIVECDFPGIYLCVQYPEYIISNPNDKIFDRFIDFEPLYTLYEYDKKTINKIKYLMANVLIKAREPKLRLRDYDEDWNKIITRKFDKKKFFAGGFVDWDNTPRNKAGLAYKGASPEKFGNYFRQLVDKVNKDYDDNFIFVNAWNEWAEGAYLEPDEKYGYKYLEELYKAVSI